MNKLSLALDLTGIDIPSEGDKKPVPAEIVSNVVKNIMFNYAQNLRGITGAERKQYYAVTDALDKALASGATEVELADTDAGFLKKCMREAKMLPSDALRRVEELIESMVRV